MYLRFKLSPPWRCGLLLLTGAGVGASRRSLPYGPNACGTWRCCQPAAARPASGCGAAELPAGEASRTLLGSTKHSSSTAVLTYCMAAGVWRVSAAVAACGFAVTLSAAGVLGMMRVKRGRCCAACSNKILYYIIILHSDAKDALTRGISIRRMSIRRVQPPFRHRRSGRHLLCAATHAERHTCWTPHAAGPADLEATQPLWSWVDSTHVDYIHRNALDRRESCNILQASPWHLKAST
jgi:hypothetical protein